MIDSLDDDQEDGDFEEYADSEMRSVLITHYKLEQIIELTIWTNSNDFHLLAGSKASKSKNILRDYNVKIKSEFKVEDGGGDIKDTLHSEK